MTADNFCFYLQNKLFQTSQTGGVRKIQYVIAPNVFKCYETIHNPANLSLLLKWFSAIKIILLF
jgi:hypothetical protein